MITCTFRVLNKLIAMTSPTFYIAWYKKERGLSLIKSTFTRKTKDSIVIGEHAFSGDTVRALPCFKLFKFLSVTYTCIMYQNVLLVIFFMEFQVICSVEEIYQLRDKKSRKSRPYFIGIKVLQKRNFKSST